MSLETHASSIVAVSIISYRGVVSLHSVVKLRVCFYLHLELHAVSQQWNYQLQGLWAGNAMGRAESSVQVLTQELTGNDWKAFSKHKFVHKQQSLLLTMQLY